MRRRGGYIGARRERNDSHGGRQGIHSSLSLSWKGKLGVRGLLRHPTGNSSYFGSIHLSAEPWIRFRVGIRLSLGTKMANSSPFIFLVNLLRDLVYGTVKAWIKNSDSFLLFML